MHGGHGGGHNPRAAALDELDGLAQTALRNKLRKKLKPKAPAAAPPTGGGGMDEMMAKVAAMHRGGGMGT
jgi:hypothetical protein